LPAPVPLDFVSSVLVSVFLTGVLSALAYRRDVLTWDGSLAAFVVGMVIGIFGDVLWLFLLLFFLLSSFLATRYRFALKEALGVQEGVRGERRSTNVLANGVALMGVAVLSLAASAAFSKVVSGIVFLSALSVAGADTLASEIGVLSRRTVLITNGQPVPPGTDGGVPSARSEPRHTPPSSGGSSCRTSRAPTSSGRRCPYPRSTCSSRSPSDSSVARSTA